MRLKSLGVAACVAAACVQAPPAAHPAPGPASSLQARSASPPQVASPAWWKKQRQRFHTLALCALASAHVTYTLLVGFTGFGVAIGFTASLLGVILCL